MHLESTTAIVSPVLAVVTVLSASCGPLRPEAVRLQVLIIRARCLWLRAVENSIGHSDQWVDAIRFDPSPAQPICEFVVELAISACGTFNGFDVLSQSFGFLPLGGVEPQSFRKRLAITP